MVLWRGDAQKYVLAMTDANGNALDLSGFTAKAAMKAGFDSTTQYDWTCSISGNEVTIYLPSSVSGTIPAGSYVWDFKLVDAVSNDQRTYLAGDVTVYDEVDA